MFKVYCAGPITGLDYDGAQDWRAIVRDALLPDIECYSPLRAQEYLRAHGTLDQSYNECPLTTDRGLMIRDHWDCQTADLIFANLIGAQRVSIGTVMEIAWAFAYRKPLVVAMEDTSSLHEHPMIREAISFRTNTLPAACGLIRACLLPSADALRRTLSATIACSNPSEQFKPHPAEAHPHGRAG